MAAGARHLVQMGEYHDMEGSMFLSWHDTWRSWEVWAALVSFAMMDIKGVGLLYLTSVTRGNEYMNCLLFLRVLVLYC